MWWVIIIFFGIFIFSMLDDIIGIIKNKDPLYRKKIEEEKQIKEQTDKELYDRLVEAKGQTCIISSKDFIYITSEIKTTAKIIDIDSEWMALEIQGKMFNKKKTRNILIKISSVENIAIKV